MSDPGYPVNAHQSFNVSNFYTDTSLGTTYNGVDPFFWRSLYEDKGGGRTPGWPHAIQTNAYVRSFFNWQQSPLDVIGTVDNGFGDVDTWGGQWGNSFGMNYVPWEDGSGFWSTQDGLDECRRRLTMKLISAIQENRVNLGEIFHTKSQAARMVASSATKIAQALLALKRGNFGGASRALLGSSSSGSGGGLKNHLGGIPEQWLALRYGWQPAVQDVYNSLELVHKAWNDGGDAFKAKAHVHISMDPLVLERWNGAAHGPTLTYRSLSRDVRGNARVQYGVDGSFLSSLSQFGITNPASLAWEILPWSFVYDWFLPIGPFLEALDYRRGLYFKTGSYSFKQETTVSSAIKSHHVVAGNITGNWSGGSGAGRAFVFTREVLTDFPSVPLPRFKDPVSLTHVANALSLLATAFGR